MTNQELAKLAAVECSSELTTAHHGGGPGRPFWNVSSFQFMYVPSFQFNPLPHCNRYKYSATSADGVTRSFEANNACALLTPIWKDIPEGIVSLKVYSLDANGNEEHLIGARTFYRMSPFTADYPPAARPYKESAKMAYDYAMSSSIVRHWLEHGTPDPTYIHNLYPSKMVGAIIRAMIKYTEYYPEKTDEAMTIAKNAADYLIAHSVGEGSPLAGMPLTYQIDFREDPENQNNLVAKDLIDTIMMIYPVDAGLAYIALADNTGEKKYFDEALKIGKYYRENVLPNGSWYLVVSIGEGKPVQQNYCSPLNDVSSFLLSLYDHTGDEVWKTLADNGIKYSIEKQLATYNWENQFEDTDVSANYSGLTHWGANALARYYAEQYPDSPEHIAIAEELVRFTEDQFIMWKTHAPWTPNGYNSAEYTAPAALEQYFWHVPICASASDFMYTFMTMYRVTKKELYVAKARALADSITRVQSESGFIPTHWMDDSFRKNPENNFWINCLFHSANSLSDFADFLRAEGLD